MWLITLSKTYPVDTAVASMFAAVFVVFVFVVVIVVVVVAAGFVVVVVVVAAAVVTLGRLGYLEACPSKESLLKEYV